MAVCGWVCVEVQEGAASEGSPSGGHLFSRRKQLGRCRRRQGLTLGGPTPAALKEESEATARARRRHVDSAEREAPTPSSLLRFSGVGRRHWGGQGPARIMETRRPHGFRYGTSSTVMLRGFAPVPSYPHGETGHWGREAGCQGRTPQPAPRQAPRGGSVAQVRETRSHSSSGTPASPHASTQANTENRHLVEGSLRSANIIPTSSHICSQI